MKLLAGSLLVFGLYAAQTVQQAFDEAVRALAKGDYTASERGFQTVLRMEPRNTSALGNLGIVYSRSNRPELAIEVYKRALAITPNDQAILLNLGLVYLKREAHAKALPYFARVVELNPGHAQARQLLDVCRVYAGDLAPAIRDLEAMPRDEQVLFLLGFAYLRNHEPDKAKAMFQQMFEAAGPVRAQFVSGKAYYEATLFPQAEECFLDVLRRDPNFSGAHLELGKVYISLRRTDDAIRELRAALKESPEANYFLGGLLVQEGKFAEGIPYLERARELKPDSWATYFYLGKAELRLDRARQAVPLLERAVALNPDEATAYYQLGQALRKCGREAEARKALEKVRDLKAAALDATKLEGTR